MESTAAPSRSATIIVVADDLIWASRLSAAVERAGGRGLGARSATELEARLRSPDAATLVLVDLGGKRYDGVEAVRAAAATGRPVVAVGQHEDVALRRRALEAGAQRVYSYNKLFRDGPAVVARFLAQADEA